jgi:PST family polysaccharide transporter
MNVNPCVNPPHEPSRPSGADGRSTTDSSKSTAEIGRRAGAAARWTVAQSLGKQVIDLLVFLLLARWLTPEAFGLVAGVMAVIVVLSTLVELGFGDALVQRQDLKPRHTNTAFWMLAGFGLCVTGLLAAIGPVIAHGQGQADLAPMFQALSPLVLAQALGVVPQAILLRRMETQPLAMRTLLSTVCGAVTGAGVALAGGGAWSLVAQQLVGNSLGLALLWRWSGWRPSLSFDVRSLAELAAFGRHVLSTRLLNVASSKADFLVVGAVLGPVALGLYSVAARLQWAMEQVFVQGIDALALSAFSRSAAVPAEVGKLHLTATHKAAWLAFPSFGLAIAAAPDAMGLVLGDRWSAALPVLQLLLCAAMLQALMHFNHAVFKACGRPQLSWRLAIFSTLLTLAGLLIAAPHGVVAVAAAYLARTALVAPVGLWLAARATGVPAISHLKAWSVPAMLTLAALAAPFAVLNSLSGSITHDAHIRLALLVGAGAAVAGFGLLKKRKPINSLTPS